MRKKTKQKLGRSNMNLTNGYESYNNNPPTDRSGSADLTINKYYYYIISRCNVKIKLIN